VRLDEACTHVVDCEHKTAPIDESGEYFAVGTPAMRDHRIDFSEARRISRETFNTWTRRLRPQPGDLLLAREAPVGPVVRLPDSAHVAPGQRTVILRPDLAVTSSRFLYYLLRSPKMQAELLVKAEGSTVHHLNVADIRALEVDLLPPPERQSSAGVLVALAEKTAANARLAVTADGLLTSTYRSAVAQDAKEVGLLDEFDVTFGEPFGGSFFSEPGDGRPLIRIRDLKTYESQVWTTEQRPRETVVEAGDVVVGMDAEFRPTIWLGKPGLLNQRVCMFTHTQFGNALVREAIRRPLEEVEKEKSATTVIHLNKSDLQRKTAMVPIGSAAKVFQREAEPVYETIVAVSLENRSLAATRDTLLPKLMSGELQVRDIEAVASGVL